MTKARKPPATKDADLATAFELTERLMAPSGQGGGTPPDQPAVTEKLGQSVRYWLWRAGGRKRPSLTDPSQVARLLDNYEMEYQRQLKAHEEEMERLKASLDGEAERLQAEAERNAARTLVELQAELVKARGRAGELEQLANDLVRAQQDELARARADGVAEGDATLSKAVERVAELERRLADQEAGHATALAAQAKILKAEAAELERAGERQGDAHAAALAAAQDQLRDAHERALEVERASTAAMIGDIETLRATHAAELERLREETADHAAQKAEAHERAIAVERERVTALERQLDAARREHLDAAVPARQDGEGALADALAHIAKLERERKTQDNRHAKELAALREEASAQAARARADGMAVADAALRKESERAAEVERQLARLRAEMAETRDHQADNGELVDARRRIVELTRAAEAARVQHHEELIRARAGADQHLAETKDRAAELETLLGQARAEQSRLERELAATRGQLAEMEFAKPRKAVGNAELEARLAAALARGTQAEDALRVANNKIELLKDALEGAKARAVLPGPGPVGNGDTRFRDAKRAFARQFHPDQGGRGDAEKERLFMEFWPVLEKIDRESGG